MLNATIENLQIRGSREILRRMDTSALVSIGRMLDAVPCWGAKLIRTLTLSDSSLIRVTGGSSRKNSWSDVSIMFRPIASFILWSLAASAALTSQLEEQTRS